MDRLFEIHPSAGNVTFADVTLREGFSPTTAARSRTGRRDCCGSRTSRCATTSPPESAVESTMPSRPSTTGRSSLRSSEVGRVEIVNSTLSGNGAGGGGAAINNAGSGTVSILAGSEVVDNPGLMIPDPQDPEDMIPAPGVYEPDSSPIANQGEFDIVGTIRIADSTVAGNYSEHDGGGVANDGRARSRSSARRSPTTRPRPTAAASTRTAAW